MGDVIEVEFPRQADGQHDQDDQHEPRKRGLRDVLPPRSTGENTVDVRPSGAVIRRPLGPLVRRDQAATVTAVAVRITYKAAKGGAKHGTRVVARVARGHGVVAGRAWHVMTLATYDEQIRLARAAGDHDQLAAWIDRKNVARRDRHRRMVELPRKVWGLVKVAGIGAGVAAGLTWVGIPLVVVAAEGKAAAAAWYHGVAETIRGVITTGAVTWHIGTSWQAAAGAVTVWGLITYAAGRHAALPQWATATADGTEGRDIIPTDGAILEALRNLGIPKLDQAFKRGWGTSGHPSQVFQQGTIQDGRGYRTQIRLPQGVNVEAINRKKDLLAHNLVRMPIEVWPTEPKDKPGVLDLWVSDQGALSGPVPPWPILAELDTYVGDYFKGVPAGVNIRGDVVKGLLSEANYAAAGIMGSGKSTLVITLLLGALLDPLVDADVFVMAENADYEPMRPRLRSLTTGAGEATVKACMNTLREAYADLEVRGKALKEHDKRAVNRALAEKDHRLRPRIIVIDECQALFMDEDRGEEAADLTVKLISASRKYAYTLVFLTPEASSASLPRKVMSVVRVKACFAIGDQQSNDAILGTGSYKAGISAVGLEPKTDESDGDIGTAMTRGFMAKPGLLRSYYVNQEDARRVVTRAVAIRKGAGITAQSAVELEPATARDFLADVDEVMGAEVKLRTDEVRHQLIERHRSTYGGWTQQDLTAALAEIGLRARKSNGLMYVRAVDVADALDAREEADDVIEDDAG